MPTYTKPTSPVLQTANSLVSGKSLLRCYPFIETSGSTSADYSGNAATATWGTSSGTTRTNAVAPTRGFDATFGEYVQGNIPSQVDAIATDVGLPTGSAARTFAFAYRQTGLDNPYLTNPWAYADYLIGYGTTGSSSLAFGLNDPYHNGTEPLSVTTAAAGYQGYPTSLVDGVTRL
jgi:hypothetical protein